MQFKRKARKDSPPDITPMIDVVFLLLIFFMLSTTFIVNPGIEITLPKSSAEQIKKEKEEITIAITREGGLYHEGNKTNITALKRIFTKAGKAAQSTVIIDADEKAAHGRVVEVMDAAKEAGILKLAISTEPKKE